MTFVIILYDIRLSEFPLNNFTNAVVKSRRDQIRMAYNTDFEIQYAGYLSNSHLQTS